MGEEDLGFEEVAVHGQLEPAVLELGQALGDVEAQAAALAVSGGVAPDKTLHQLVGADVQGLPGDVLNGDDHVGLPKHGRHIDPGPGQGVLDHVAQQIVQHPPEELAVGQNVEVRLQGHHHLQLSGLQPGAVLLHGLVHQLRNAGGHQRHRQIAGGGLGGFHQVLGQLLEPLGLAVQYLEILGALLVAVGLLQQVHIVDDGGQRRLDVVGDIGNQFGFQPLGLHSLVHSPVHTLGDGVEVFPVALEIPVELIGVELIIEVSGGQLLARLPQRHQLLGPQNGHQKQQQVVDRQ